MRPKDMTFKKGQIVKDAFDLGLRFEIIEEDDPKMTIGPCVTVKAIGASVSVFMEVDKLQSEGK